MKKLLPVLSAIALALPVMAHAGTTSILFDADGSGLAYTPTPVDLLDFKPGNALSVGGGGIATGSTVQLLYQANLGLTSLGGISTSLTCSFGASCLTAVAGFQETATVTSTATTTNASFTLGGTAGPLPSATNFFYIYAKPTGAAVNAGKDLAGKGFASGILILSGYISQVSSSNFTTDRSTELFDQFGGDNYGGKKTIVGSGATDLTVTITSSSMDYFPGLNASGLAFSFFNTSTVTPFKQVDPSQRFSSNGLLDGDLAPVLGTPNGFTGPGGTTADFQLQADGNQSFFAVPEPGTITLVGMALAGLGFIRRRRA